MIEAPGAALAQGAGRVRRDPAARRALAEWRRLAGGGRTLLAVSGGADSTALALAIAPRAPGSCVIGHVRHVMRSHAETRADRDAVAQLAQRLQTPFVEAALGPIAGNPEDTARRARRRALAELAARARCVCVATGHTADDQAETLIMALARGAGLRGWSAMPASAPLGPGVSLIRPMLGVTRADSERLCRLAGVPWRDDHTNDDPARARAHLRARVTPALRQRWPGVAERLSAAARVAADAQGLVEDRAAEVFGDVYAWPRDRLRRERAIVLDEGLRSAWRRLTGGVGADRLGRRRVGPAVDAIRDRQTVARRFEWPGGVELVVGARLVAMQTPECAGAGRP